MIPIITGVLVSLGLFVGSINDFLTREVPDSLSYGLIILGIFQGIILSILNWSYLPFVYSALGLLLMLLLSLLLYYTGQWGGGDAKLFMGIGAFLGFNFNLLPQLPALIVFLINSLLVGGVYGLAWALWLMVKHWKEFSAELKSRYAKQRQRSAVFIGLTLLVTIAGQLLFQEPIISFMLGFLPALLLLGYFLWMCVAAVEQVCFYKIMHVSKLTEGDWIIEDVVVDGRRLVKVSDFGVTNAQIAKLRDSGIKKVLIKEGIPFVPSIFIAFIVTVLFFDWFLYLL